MARRKRKNGNNGNNGNHIGNDNHYSTYELKDNLKLFTAQTEHQKEYIRSIYENTVTICHGFSGSGKSMCSIGIACQQLHRKEIKNVVVAKPIIGCDNEVGTLPGTLNERIHPYMYPVLEYFEYFLGKFKAQQLLNVSINLFPIELVRGHTYNNSFMILEEAQNCTPKQVKLFLSRIGHNSKVVIIGDEKQSDIGNNNGLQFCIDNFNKVKDINVVRFDKYDVLRHPLIPDILEIFENKGI